MEALLLIPLAVLGLIVFYAREPKCPKCGDTTEGGGRWCETCDGPLY